MNPWIFLNNTMFGYLTGLTMGFFESSHYTDTNQPAYVTAWYVGAIAGLSTVASVLFYLINSGILK